MFCSLCLNHKNKGIKLPCSHHLCFKCFPQVDHSQNPIKYQCETCFQVHQINLQNLKPQQTNNFYPSKQDLKHQSLINYEQNSQSIFCWTCCKLLSLKQYIKGTHHEHKVQTIEQAFPEIKNLMLQQLQKSLTLKDYLQQTRMLLETNILKKEYSSLMDKIGEFFDKQIEIVECKRQKILNQLQSHYSKSLKQINKNFQFIHPLMINVCQIEQKISAFLTDKAPITIINPINQIISELDNFGTKIKDKKIIIPQLPTFIPKSTLKESIQNTCQLFEKNYSNQQQTINEKKSSLKLKQNSFLSSQNKLKFSIKSSFKEENNKDQFRKVLTNSSNLNKKVKLVEKVKGKMKYSSNFCSTTFC